MPEWLHGRAMHILAKNPSMGKSQAFAIATQQSHATGHTPKSYGTSQGKHEAKAKYDDPKSTYESTADPGRAGKKLERAEDKGAVQIKQAWMVQKGRTLLVGPGSDMTPREIKLLRQATPEVLRDPEVKKHFDSIEWSHEKRAGIPKQAGKIGAFISAIVAPEQQRQVQELRKEVDTLKAALPQTKQASLMLASPLDAAVIGGFSDELTKIAGFIENWVGNKLRTSPALQEALADATKAGLKEQFRRHAGIATALGIGVAGLGIYGGYKLKQMKDRLERLEQRTPEGPAPSPQYAAPVPQSQIAKQANLSSDSVSAKPMGLTEIKSTIPTKPLSGKTPKYSKVNADPSPSPLTGTQPISDPPPTRA